MAEPAAATAAAAPSLGAAAPGGGPAAPEGDPATPGGDSGEAAAGSPAAGAPLAIEPAEREVVLEEIAAVAGAVREPRASARYAELAAAVAGGEVAPALAGPLQQVLEMSLSTGRARRLHGAQHEAALLRLFFRTPAGTALRHAAGAANRALSALAGQRLDAVSVTAQAPGVFRLQLDTDRCQLTLEVSRDGVEVAGLGVEI
jgi:hypothetical protein